MKAEDPQRPDGRFVIGISDIRGKVGAHRAIVEQVEMGEIVLESAHVRSSTMVDLDVDLEVLADGLAMTGTVGAGWTGECRRCLEVVSGNLVATIDEIFEVRHSEGETYRLGYDTVDIEPAVRDTLALNLPMTPLCQENCVGPDPERFPTSSEPGASLEPEAEPARSIDPRWAALSDVTFDGPDAASDR